MKALIYGLRADAADATRPGVDATVVVTAVQGCPLKKTGGWKPLIHGCTAYSSL